MTARRGLPTGVQRKHSKGCPAREGGRCRCGSGYQVQAGPRGARTTRTFRTVAEAVAWKRDADQARLTPVALTFRDAAARWRRDAHAGVALARGRQRFRPSTLADYERLLDSTVLDELGGSRLDRISRERLNAFAAMLAGRGLAASTVRNTLMPVRAVFRHAVNMGWTQANPTVGMIVPAGAGRRMRVIEPSRIGAYLAAIAENDRALWATAILAGLRRGELMALRWPDVDLLAGVIRVDAHEGAYERHAGQAGAPKTHAGARRVPITGTLRDLLLEHRARDDSWRGLVFARGQLAGRRRKGVEDRPFNPGTIGRRARTAFEDAGLEPVTLHDCRHTFASLTIAAMAARGVFNPKLLQEVLGHSSIQVTFDRYGHLFPGQHAMLGEALDDLLAVRPQVTGPGRVHDDDDAIERLVEERVKAFENGERAVRVQRRAMRRTR